MNSARIVAVVQTIAFVQAAIVSGADEKLDPRGRQFLAHLVSNPHLTLQELAQFAGIRTREGARRLWKAGLYALWRASNSKLQARYPVAELLKRKRGTFKPHSPQTRAKLRTAQTGRKMSVEAREKMRLVQTGKRHSSETRARMRESQLKRWESRKQRLAA